MLDKFTYKQKNIGLAIVSLLVVYYLFTNILADTIDLKNQCNELAGKLKSADNAPMLIAQMKAEVAQIDQIIGDDNQTDNSFQERILEAVSNYSNKHQMEVHSFQEPMYIISNGYDIETNIVTVSGKFKNIVLLISELEQNKRIAQIVSVFYESKKDYLTNKTDLLATIHFQNIKKKK